MPDRLELHQRIEQRLSKMWDIGFLNEVEELIGKYDLNEIYHPCGLLVIVKL